MAVEQRDTEAKTPAKPQADAVRPAKPQGDPKPVKTVPPTKPRVVKLADPPAPIARRRGWALRHKILALSFVLACLLPASLGALYYGGVAADRYASGAGFAVRGLNAGGGIDLIGSFTGIASSGSTTSDSYIILAYLRSRDLVQELQQEFDLPALFGGERGDILTRLPDDPSAETLTRYWDGMIRTEFDPNSGIISFEVQAFDPGEAKALADAVLAHANDLVNRLSETARRDSVRFAEAEVARAEERLRAALEEVREFRSREQSLDPAADAAAEIELVTGLERQLLDLRARIGALTGSMDDNAPSLVALRRQADALEAQIRERTETISGASASSGLSGLLAAYESYDVDKTFAQQAYASALSSLEQARVEADRQQRYLAVYTTPSRPEDSAYPRRLRNALLLAGAFFCLWGIGALVSYSVRDHLS